MICNHLDFTLRLEKKRMSFLALIRRKFGLFNPVKKYTKSNMTHFSRYIEKIRIRIRLNRNTS